MTAGAYSIHHPADEMDLLLYTSIPNIIDLWWVVVDKLMVSETLTLLYKQVKCQSQWSMTAGVYA